jgi:Primase C terminal 1 (PriCT-1)/Homeodomain-like domain
MPKARCYRPEDTHGIGRNVTLFGWLGPDGRWAYRRVRKYWGRHYGDFFEAVLLRAVQLNGDFQPPLSYPEVAGIARSVARWAWRRFTPERFSEWQRQRGRASIRQQYELAGPVGFSLIQAARGRRSGEIRRDRDADMRAKANRLKREGKSHRQTAAILGRPRTTVQRWTKDP